MNVLLKYFPLLLNSRVIKGKKRWLAVLFFLVSGYQLFNPNGVGARWGIPSYDTFYNEPRDILIKRVQAASDAQQDTAEEFRSALDKFKSVVNFEGGDLEKRFTVLSAAFNDSESAAKRVSSRVDRVVSATNNVLEEWRAELSE